MFDPILWAKLQELNKKIESAASSSYDDTEVRALIQENTDAIDAVEAQLGDVAAACDSIIAIQNQLIDGNSSTAG